MSGSHDGSEEEKLFSEQPEWQDVVPIPQDDGPSPLVPIAYSKEYADAMSYFRGILSVQERSERVLTLTEFIVRLNPGHYSVWKYRQDTVFSLGLDLEDELAFVEEMAEDQPKSYQIWHHRQAVVTRLGDPSREISFINRMLAIDSKNYHAWSYRQWVVSTFNLWDRELKDVDRLLESDVRNNSAWNQRYWVHSKNTAAFTDLQGELDYVIERIRWAPRNESPWVYLRGIVRLAGKTLADLPRLEALCEEFQTSGQASPHALSLLLDLEVERKDGERCKKICAMLVENDPVRAKYWRYRAEIAV
ncbi:hypothetical protein HKX48_008473 [Thoreauomyces humboldtii]|nr:hypothetical protein HKX48_008473 [Thoreauomyces humboldtii]